MGEGVGRMRSLSLLRWLEVGNLPWLWWLVGVKLPELGKLWP